MLLDVQNLSVTFKSHPQDVQAVCNVSFSIRKGEILALVGESGSGKSTVALSIMGLLPALEADSKIFYKKQQLTPDSIGEIRGNRISMIFQEPMMALNPLHNIYRQISEALLIHQPKLKSKEVRKQVHQLLDDVGLTELKNRLNALPHTLSGGQRQRVMIAMAMANKPDLLIADEPTTALDVTVQAQILRLLKELQQKTGMAVLLITHDLCIVRKMADNVAVMQHGQIVEQTDTETLFAKPSHAYTQKLLDSRLGDENISMSPGEILLEAQNLHVRYLANHPLLPWNRCYKDALEDVSITIPSGSTLGIVGESGSGKSTLGLALLRLIKSEGTILYTGARLDTKNMQEMRSLRKEMQIVFQDPFSSLNPRMTVEQIVGEGLEIHRRDISQNERREIIADMLREVGLDPESRHRFPHEFSGGQRQRIAIARAMVLNPKLLILDEPTSALDVSIQKQIITLLRRFQEKFGTTYAFISHDLRVIKAISHHIIVMKEGRIVEQGATQMLFSNPKENYTQTLISSAFSENL